MGESSRRWRGRWKLALGLACLSACTSAPDTQRRPAPTGRYEGTLRYHGAELPVVLQLTQDSASRVVRVLLQAPTGPVYSRLFDSVSYAAATLRGQLPGGSRLLLREEPNFLTGQVWLNDTLRADLVAVRRGSADLPAYTLIRPTRRAAPLQLRYVPLDTAAHRPAVLLWAPTAAVGSAAGWADWLAQRGVVVLVAASASQPDSLAAPQLAALYQQLRDYGAAGVDTSRVAVWAVGTGSRAALRAVVAWLRPAGLLLQNAPLAPADQLWLRGWRRYRVPVLALYGPQDTTLNVPESSRVLRRAVGGASAVVQVLPGAGTSLLLSAAADSVGGWPLPPPELGPVLLQWLQGLPAR